MRWLLANTIKILLALAGLAFLSRFVTDNLDPYYFQVLILCGIYITLVVSLNLINGITGQFSIGHAGFYAVGAYVGAAWTVLWSPILAHRMPFLTQGNFSGDSINLVIGLALGAISAAIAGLVVGLPSLRLRGDYLAIVTLGFGEVIRVVLYNIDAVGASRGLSGIPTLVSTGNMAVFWVFGLAWLVVLVSRNLMSSVRGLTWLAVREDEIAADAMGVNTTTVKVSAFVIGSAFAGAAGVLYAHFFTLINPDVFNMNASIEITTMVVLGGTGSVTGSICAATLLTSLPEVLRTQFPAIKDYRMVIYSVLLIVMMLTRPQGLFGKKELGFRWIRLRKKTSPEGGSTT